MSDETTEPGPVDEAEGESGEPSRIAGGIVLLLLGGVAVLILKAVVTVAPYVAYFVAGILATVGWQKARGWIGRRQASDGGEPGEVAEEDLVQALHDVAAPNVFLAELAAELAVSKEDARALLEAHGIRVRRAVRNGDDTGVGVHRNDLPPLPRPSPETPERGVEQGQRNQPTRPTAEPIGLAGVVVKDGSEAIRHHRVRN